MNHRPVGPHLSGSFETWVPQESLARALSWFTQNRGTLSVLIHPLTRYERADHSTHAMWLGQPWTLDLEMLREDAGNPEHQYPELGLGYSKAADAVWIREPHSRLVMRHAIAAVLAFIFALPPANAKRKSTVSSAEEFWMFFAVVYGLVLVPVVGYFLYALARDPATPELARLMWQWFTRKTLGFLGDHRDPAVQHVRQPRAPMTSPHKDSRSAQVSR